MSPVIRGADRQLYRRILEFQFDDGDVLFPFVSRLERDRRWSRAYAVRAVSEYRKFVFLAVVAGHPVSPSSAVDEVWHLHLLHTRSYWQRFCAEVLRRPLHHEPTRGGPRERDKFHEWYAATLESYRRYFGDPPPPDIWPDPRHRFGARRGEPGHWLRVFEAPRFWMRAAAMRGSLLAAKASSPQRLSMKEGVP